MRTKKRNLYSFAAVAVIIFAVFAAVFASAVLGNSPVRIILRTNSAEMYQGGDVPRFTATAFYEKNQNLSGLYEDFAMGRVKELVEELNSGKGYILTCEADGKAEGSFLIKPSLTEEVYQNELVKSGGVIIETQDGTLNVKNKYGEWEENRFRHWDGSYAESEFIVSKGQTYYFDENGQKATGWHDISGERYYFDENGAMRTGWAEIGDNKYYFGTEGAMHTGWLEHDGEKYFFSVRGEMLTGEQRISNKKCVFSLDGRLEHEEILFDPEKPMVAITFDDGPAAGTMEILETLEKNNARATFFMLGQNISYYPQTVLKMAEIGCELGNHTQSHKNLTKLSDEEIKKELENVNQKLENITGLNAAVMRPPYGALNSDVQSQIDVPIILWSIDTLDWKTRDTQQTIYSVLKNVKDGDIILMHDIHRPTVEAAKYLIPELINRGYQLVTVSELAEAKGVFMQSGKKYSAFR